MSSSLSVCPHLPPTTNILNAQQRTQLVRSTRKLGAVLGATPYILESDCSSKMLPIGKSTTKRLKRQGSIFTHHHQLSSLSVTSVSTTSSYHPSPSPSSLDLVQNVAKGLEILPANPPGLSSTRCCRSDGKAPSLCLRLNQEPASPTTDRVALSQSAPPTPTTPIVPDVAEIRRKRMAKLARHLGEHIPAELVFASEQSSSSTPVPPRRRAPSVGKRTEAAQTSVKKPFRQSKQEWVGEWNRSNIKDVQKELRNLRIR